MPEPKPNQTKPKDTIPLCTHHQPYTLRRLPYRTRQPEPTLPTNAKTKTSRTHHSTFHIPHAHNAHRYPHRPAADLNLHNTSINFPKSRRRRQKHSRARGLTGSKRSVTSDDGRRSGRSQCSAPGEARGAVAGGRDGSATGLADSVGCGTGLNGGGVGEEKDGEEEEGWFGGKGLHLRW
ncbi:MAG: hypothetical protein M1831_000412 [Alyxoria varia]|nr:MAG: hypothetical protein M1831_000412 [Alyxoria varia]